MAAVVPLFLLFKRPFRLAEAVPSHLHSGRGIELSRRMDRDGTKNRGKVANSYLTDRNYWIKLIPKVW